jgi:hypothetical protein
VLDAINAIQAPDSIASLKSKFLQAFGASDLTESTKMSIMKKIIKKTFHARAKVETAKFPSHIV